MAYINMVTALHGETDGRTRQYKQKQRIANEGQVPPKYFNGFPVLPYGKDVILDSGASDHMTGNRALLTDIRDFFVQVMMPDGFVVNTQEAGTMRILVTDPETGEESVVPLLNTLLVEGIHTNLVSIPALNASGILARFNTNTAEILVNGNTITINDPYHRRMNESGLPFAAPMQRVDDPLRPAISPNANKPPPVKTSLDLMHRRMGHRSLRAVIAAEASGIWEGVRLRQTPDEYCVDCHIGGIPRAKRGQSPPSEATQPGAVLFLDVIPNPAHGGPTPSTSFSDYLEVACAYSRYFAFIGLKSTTSYDIIEGVKQFVVDH